MKSSNENNFSKSPLFFFLFILATMFFVEYVILLFLHFAIQISFENEFIIDSISSTIIMTPILYYFFLKPLKNQIKQCQLSKNNLVKSEARLDSIIKNIPEVIYSFKADESRSILYISDLWEKWTGYSPEECYNNASIWSNLIHPDDKDRIFTQRKYCINDKKRITAEYRLINKDSGKIKWVYDRGMPIVGDDHIITRYEGILSDITESKMAEKELKIAHKRMYYSEKMASIGELSASLFHDIKQPLSALFITSDLMEAIVKKNDFKEIKEFSDGLKKQVEYITNLVNSLNISSAKSVEDKFKSVDLNVCIKNINTLLIPQIRQDGIKLKLNFSDDPSVVNASRIDVETILLNILNNARFAVKSNKGKKIIEVVILNRRNTKAIVISDNGSGIPEDIIDKIFNPFFTTKKIGEGTGMGLSSCHSIVQRYHGTISVESEVNKGTVFTVYFPV